VKYVCDTGVSPVRRSLARAGRPCDWSTFSCSNYGPGRCWRWGRGNAWRN
jgi:hypothetical protein